MSAINGFSIIGERCSGTNFLEEVVKRGFNIPVKKGSTGTMDHKHWMQPENYLDRTQTDSILYIGIIRDPVQWLGSFRGKPFHVPGPIKANIHSFLTSEWHSINDEKDYKEIMHDRHPYTKERFKNIFELRKVKARFLMDDMPKLVKNYIFIRYEDLLNNMPNLLNQISQITGLPITGTPARINWPSTHRFPPDIMEIISTNIDRDTEKALGYNI